MRRLALIALLLLVPAGCAAGDEPQRQSTRPGPGGTVVAALGDSISAGTPLWDPDPGRRADLAQADRRSQYEYWAERRLPGTDFRNCGVPGERTDQIERRLERCAEGARVLIVQGGVNDVAQGRPLRSAAADLRDMVRRGKRLGLRVALVELLPWNGGYPDAAAPILRLNERIHVLADREHVPVIEWYDVLEDPDRPDRMRLDWTSDLAHPSIAGYRRLGRAVELP